VSDEGSEIRQLLARAFAFLGTAMVDYVVDLEDHCEQAEKAADYIFSGDVPKFAPGRDIEKQVNSFCAQARANIQAKKGGK
jgi:anthranilate/para-aminobenzoate synthase component I